MDVLCKVLIVEDEYLTRQGIRHMLDWGAEGFEIVGEAGNGKDALELVEKLHPHIVLTDMVMPVMDGLELEKRLRETHPEIQLAVLSSYSDFGYVRDSFQSGAVDYILKPTLNPKDLLAAMKQLASHIPGLTLTGRKDRSLSLCVEQLLSGYPMEDLQRQLQAALDKPDFVLMGMDTARIFVQDPPAADRQEKLLAQAADTFLADYTHVQLTAKESIQLLAVNLTPWEREPLFAALRALAEDIAQKEPRTFYVASEVCTGLSLLRKTYSGPFLRNMDRYFYCKGRHFMTGQEFGAVHTAPKFDSADYAKCLEALQADRALDTLEGYVRRVLAEQSLDEPELKTLVQNAWYQLMSTFEDQHLSPDNLASFKRDCFAKIQACAYSEEFAQVFSVLQADFRAIIVQYGLNAQGNTIRSILRYIDEHYAQPLTLSGLAQQFSFNYTYLSSYFRTHHKEGFSEYLNRVRIRHAAELLREGTLAVSRVCEAVGYTDQSYFTRVFKKWTGTTPRDYRRRRSAAGE